MKKETTIRNMKKTVFPYVSFDSVLLATVLSTIIFDADEYQKHCTMPIPTDEYNSINTLRCLYAATDAEWDGWDVPTITEVLKMNHRIGKKHPDIDKMLNVPAKRLTQLIKLGLIDCDDPEMWLMKLDMKWMIENTCYGMSGGGDNK